MNLNEIKNSFALDFRKRPINQKLEIMLTNFLSELKRRNSILYYGGLVTLICAGICLVLMQVTDAEILGVNAWLKPFKFHLSNTIFVWTMAWLCEYLNKPRTVKIYSWMLTLVMATELFYITSQSALGETSHFNVSTAYNNIMWAVMGTSITILTVWTAYIGILFFIKKFPNLPKSYVWGIRMGILLFVIFAFEGFLMAGNVAHTVGAADGGEGLPVTNWSTKNGDLRVAHFLGMHALQLVPLFAYFFTKKTWQTILFSLIYLGGVTAVLLQALAGQPFLPL